MPHIHEKIDFTTSAYVIYNDKVLLRFHQIFKKWFAPGGHIELNEDPIAAVKRELKEETGLEIELIPERNVVFDDGTTDLPAPAFMNRHHFNDKHEHVDLIYVARTTNDTLRPQQGTENAEAKLQWFTEQELSDPANHVEPRIQNYAKEALKIARENL